MKTGWISLTILLALGLASCRHNRNQKVIESQTPAMIDEPLTSPESPSQNFTKPVEVLILSTTQPDALRQGEATQLNPSLPIPSLSTLEKMVKKARMDLAQRLSIQPSQINLVKASEVTWPDTNLGCPQKGMAYSEVLTPGYLILFENNGIRYEYHTSRHDQIVTCKDPE